MPHFDKFSGFNGVQIWIHLFQEDLFSWTSRLPNNLNYSIRMSDGQVMA